MTVWRAALCAVAIAALAAPAAAHVLGESSDDHPEYDANILPPILRAQAPSLRAVTTPTDWVLMAAAILDGRALRPPVQALSGTLLAQAAAPASSSTVARVQRSFAPFAPDVRTRADALYFYVESNGMPNHGMMVGITAWQQQVPIPQAYYGTNAWRFPLVPVPAEHPLSAREHFFRGAIAIAADGVPIFNPIKNDGRTDTFLAGELDTYGGHAGRADDYHYHLAPVFLEELVGPGIPVAYALDGYAIHGFRDPDGTVPTDLDAFNGHMGQDGYHYHATRTYPYLNGGFHGTVAEVDGQVDPQPAARGVREATDPLRGATIVGFEKSSPGEYSLQYRLNGGIYTVKYAVDDARNARFEFIDPAGRNRVETYSATRGRR